MEGPYAGVPLGAGAPLPPLEQPDQGDAVLSALLTSSTSPPSAWRPVPGAQALLRVRIEGQLRWKVGVRQADYEAGEECEIWMGNGSEQRVRGGEREGILGRNKSEMTYGS